ncbi:MAG: undecaprenyl-diphosphate phosphatase [Nanoarchaeota archaeon]|nr:undecaprenyl-diphosphate phosphatase [Nanoarchaeota archaeon]
MTGVLEALGLGALQGVTEWLPISSSGHLALVQTLFSIDVPVAFDAVLHVATLLVILGFFRNDLWKIIRSWARRDIRSPHSRLGLFVLIGTVPTALIGLLLEPVIVAAFTSLTVVGIGFLITTLFLVASKRPLGTGKVSAKLALLVGTIQGLAIFPGISRSGSTITTALFGKVSPQEAARFSFLLFIPASVGAMLLQADDLLASTLGLDILLAGSLAAIVVGYLSLKLLFLVVDRNRLWYFAPYTLIVGLVALLGGLYA